MSFEKLWKKTIINKKELEFIFFCRSETAVLISEGVSDLHCMSDEYLAEELIIEFRNYSKK